jgi:hypothetical protein
MTDDRIWPPPGRLRQAAFIWSLPLGALGVLGALLFRLLGWGQLRLSDGALEIIARGPLARWMANNHWAAFTLGWTIIYWQEEFANHPSIRRHEREHIRQFLRFGPLMAVLYPLAGLLAAVGGGHFYRDNPFEKAARDAARS